MRIERTRILNENRYLDILPQGAAFRTVFEVTNRALARAGFEQGAVSGDTILPALVGRTTRYNAEGRYRIRRDLPKEERYVGSREFTRTEYHGNERVEVSDVVDYYRLCYRRDFEVPPSLEITLIEQNDRRIIISPELTYDAANANRNRHAINLILEIAGNCEIVREDLQAIAPPAVRRANWVMLPPGQHPWERIEAHIGEVFRGRAPAVVAAVLARQQVILEHGPAVIHRGIAGFSDYLAYEFTDRGLVVLESIRYGNAMYVFGEQWEELSRLTKAQIIQGELAHRIIHTKEWRDALARTLNADRR